MTSIVILTFNSIRFIEDCLNSIFSQTYSDIEVIVVDNGSQDGTVELIKKKFLKIILVENNKNLGACMARNIGIKKTSGEWVLTLDCDVVLKNDFLEKIVGFAGASEQTMGMFQPKILQWDKETIFSCGVHLSNFRRFHDIGRGARDDGRFNKGGEIFGACSAAALYKRDLLEDIKDVNGYFDKRFFFLVEDVDLAWRAQKKGWKAMFFPEAICYHSGNSSNCNRKLRQYLCFRNRYWSISKNERFGNYCKKILPLLFYDAPRSIYMVFSNPYMLKRPLKYTL